tara:strand:- start:284 stop:919 length:636 start_codon:yes stop_codon:yes gene_type:complete
MQQHEFLIGTVRFNNKTYIENLKWKQRKEYKGCAYGLDKPLSNKIPSGKYIYIIEMNNEINKIMGIGKIKNIIIHSNRSRMYNEDRLNNYIYKSKDFIPRLKIIETQPKGELVLKFLENLLFRGSKHFKRGQGCVILPWNRISTAGNIIKTKNSSYPVKNLKNKCRICGKTKKGHICEALKKNLLLEKFIYNWFANIFNDIPADADNGPHI